MRSGRSLVADNLDSLDTLEHCEQTGRNRCNRSLTPGIIMSSSSATTSPLAPFFSSKLNPLTR